MSFDDKLPQEIINTILEILIESHPPNGDSNVHCSSLLACSRVSCSFYWSATTYLFRDIRLSLASLIWVSERAYTEGDRQAIATLNAPLIKFTQITKQNRSLLPLIRSIQLNIDTRQLILHESSELWNILDSFLQYNHEIDIRAITIMGPLWRPDWEDNLGSWRVPSFESFLGLAKDKLHFGQICPSEVRELSRFQNVHHISFSNGTTSEDSVEDLVPSVYPSVSAFSHIDTVTLDLSISSIWMNYMISQLHVLFGSMVTLEIIYRHVKTYSRSPNDGEINFGALRQLKTFKSQFFLEFYKKSNIEPVSSQTIVQPLVNYAGTSTLDTIILVFSIHYRIPHMDYFVEKLASSSRPFNPDTRNFFWSDFRPEAFLVAHPNLQKLNITLNIQSSYQLNPHSHHRVYTPYEYHTNKEILGGILEKHIIMKITGSDDKGTAVSPQTSLPKVHVNVVVNFL